MTLRLNFPLIYLSVFQISYVLKLLLFSAWLSCCLSPLLLKKKNRYSRRKTMDFLGQGSFFGIRAFRKTIIYNTKKKGHAGKNLHFFLLESPKNCTLNEKLNSLMTAIRAFPSPPPQNQGTFFQIPKKGRGDLSPPPCSYAPV